MARSKINSIETTSIKTTGSSDLNGPVTFGGTVTGNGVTTFATSVIFTGDVPTTFTASGEPGQIAFGTANTATAAFLYFCHASNSWGRVTFSQTAFA